MYIIIIFYKYINLICISLHQRPQTITEFYQPSEESRWEGSEDEDDEEVDKKPLQDKPQTQRW